MKPIFNFLTFVDQKYPLYTKIIRFGLSGGLATGANIAILFMLTHFFHVWYLLSAAIAFLTAFIISFVLQKFWTYRDGQKETIVSQFIFFFVAVVGGLIFNTGFVYCLVEYFSLHYLLAQITSGVIIAIANFFIYKLIFKSSHA